ncbi:terpene synthase 10-like protein isoform X3 [Cinnamomum micranthum f. kanehirae]|uniref:Terpene synthase 10-like protein isoform X3 n=1 Tax=Cinnamomum micranthum f. kanehirae TaxID=337451 RepID=A0A443Q4Y6_9MAGN|nr:terpene synthase 10-like protein isoform X3 [Cinnamomum micranthum f. kanehirae]
MYNNNNDSDAPTSMSERQNPMYNNNNDSDAPTSMSERQNPMYNNNRDSNAPTSMSERQNPMYNNNNDSDAPTSMSERQNPMYNNNNDSDAPTSMSERQNPMYNNNNDSDAPTSMSERQNPMYNNNRDSNAPTSMSERQNPMYNNNRDSNAPTSMSERQNPMYNTNRDSNAPTSMSERQNPIYNNNRDSNAPTSMSERQNPMYNTNRDSNAPTSMSERQNPIYNNNRDSNAPTWWELLALPEKLGFFRDRLLENYLFAIGVVVEPQYSLCRIVITKAMVLITAMDDIYDVHYSYFREAQWFNSGYTPKFDEYLDNALVSVGVPLVLGLSYPMIQQHISKAEIDLIPEDLNLLRWASIIFRLYNDLATSKAEQQRGTCQNPSISEEVGANHIRDLISDAWKELNAECLKPTSLSKHYVGLTLNSARSGVLMYHHDFDGFAVPRSRTSAHITSIFFEPVPLKESINLG